MKELSVFVDESGDFGEYSFHSPYYIITLVFHDQSIDISDNINRLNNSIKRFGLPGMTVHASPLIRKEFEFRNMNYEERKQIFNCLYYFAKAVRITYNPIIVEKKHISDSIELYQKLSKRLSDFLRANLSAFSQYDRIVIYYDNGQIELTKLLASVFTSVLGNVDFKKVIPASYKLFQAADLFCTLELLNIKQNQRTLSKSELTFFHSEKELRKSYLDKIRRKQFNGEFF